MNAPVVTEIDPRQAWLGVVAVHSELVDRGVETVARGYAVAIRAHAHWFGSPAECPTCGLAPCQSPTFCAACAAADQKRGRR